MASIVSLDDFRDSCSTGVTRHEVLNTIKKYNDLDATICIGSDSMLFGNKCVMVTAICMHSRLHKSSCFFYTRKSLNGFTQNDLAPRIMNEVQNSIEIANHILSEVPETSMQIHVDIGSTKKSKTRTLVSCITGWITSLGYDLIIKPDSWASSSVADWFTK